MYAVNVKVHFKNEPVAANIAVAHSDFDTAVMSIMALLQSVQSQTFKPFCCMQIVVLSENDEETSSHYPHAKH